ncbi:MAG: preprotein translocase subunit YajC [Clostridiales bacterium]|nr:preprotein translocase subunit YajC [Clostridiales bacterium]
MNPNSPTFSLVLMALLILMIYFMMIRPQRKKEKAEKAMRDALKVGDEVITIGGVIGKVEKITDKTVVISTTAAKNKIEFLKSAIGSVTSSDAGSSKPAAKEEAKDADEAKAPSRDKKVTPKKLGKKTPDAE